MSVLKDRERALEELYYLDEEKKFKATVRAVEYFGGYISRLLVLSPGATQTLVERYAKCHFESGSIDDVIALGQADLDASEVDASPLLLKKEYEALFREALGKFKEGEEKSGVP
jgi:hypothetical protein